jgi:hypothetical protein
MQGASGASNALSERMYSQQRADQMPYMQSGYNALNAYNRAMGLAPVDTAVATQASGPGGLKMVPERYNKKTVYVDQEGNGYVMAAYGENKGEILSIGKKYPQYATPKPAAQGGAQGGAPAAGADRYGGFYASPGYQFRMDQGTQAYDRSASARGRLLSGAQVKAQTRYGQGVASEEFGNYTNRLAAIAGLGQSGTQGAGNAAANYAQNGSNALMNSGMARASGYLGTANSISNVANGVMASIPYWSANKAPSAQAGYSAPGTGGFMPIKYP